MFRKKLLASIQQQRSRRHAVFAPPSFVFACQQAPHLNPHQPGTSTVHPFLSGYLSAPTPVLTTTSTILRSYSSTSEGKMGSSQDKKKEEEEEEEEDHKETAVPKSNNNGWKGEKSNLVAEEEVNMKSDLGMMNENREIEDDEELGDEEMEGEKRSAILVDPNSPYPPPIQEAEILGEVVSAEDGKKVTTARNKQKDISPRKVRFLSPQETIAIEFQKMAHRLSQEGPFVGSKNKDVPVTALDLRKRREIERVPQYKAPWKGFETSFRRLPERVFRRLPNEHQLRCVYPLSTTLKIEHGEANCADLNAMDVMEDPLPIKYCKLLPEGYDPKKRYPYLVCLSDWRGLETDFHDVCANWFERPNVLQGLKEQEWVIFAPQINIKHSIVYPIEAVVARFCDWVAENFNVEGGKVHLFGKGLGGFAALRSCVEYSNLAISCTAILGRMSSPFRPLDRPQEKVKNLNGTHVLMFVPGTMRKVDYPYRFKAMCDVAQTSPPVRCIHYADVRDHQVYYAVNPYEFWNYLQYFRTNNALVPSSDDNTANDDDAGGDDEDEDDVIGRHNYPKATSSKNAEAVAMEFFQAASQKHQEESGRPKGDTPDIPTMDVSFMESKK